MKHHALFSSEESKKTKYCRLLQFLLDALRVNAFLSVIPLPKSCFACLTNSQEYTIKTNLTI